MRQIYNHKFNSCIGDLMGTPVVRSMSGFTQHRDVSCLEHCIFVAGLSHYICCGLGLDETAAARGGLLHDMFLYDWHKVPNPKGLHGFFHAATALENAQAHFELTERERDIIEKHMWPLTFWHFPKCREAFVVCGVDKFCTLIEVIGIYGAMKLWRGMPVKLAGH